MSKWETRELVAKRGAIEGNNRTFQWKDCTEAEYRQEGGKWQKMDRTKQAKVPLDYWIYVQGGVVKQY